MIYYNKYNISFLPLTRRVNNAFYLQKKYKQRKKTKSLLRVIACKSRLSGEIFKEPFVDLFLTHLEQTAFSLTGSRSESRSIRHNFGDLQQFEKKAANRELLKSSAFSASTFQTNKTDFTKPNSLSATNKKNLYSISFSNEKKSQTSSKVKLNVKIGDYVHSGDKIGKNCGRTIVLSASGKIIRISATQIVIQRTQPVLYYSQAHVHVKKDDWVEQNAPILTLTHQTLITGDIVQGIPRIEQLFEAPNSPPPGLREGGHLHETLHSGLRDLFRQNWIKMSLPAAVRFSLQQIQQILVESIQKVYLSQGVLIADKHIEIVVRQMTSKAELLDSGDTGLLLEELLSIQHIENANLTQPGKKALYAPAVVGLTRSALESDSFISAASFQETTRVLSRDATTGQSDFVRGLKEKVVIGDLISAGTGLDIYFAYTLLSPVQSVLKIDTNDEHDSDPCLL